MQAMSINQLLLLTKSEILEIRRHLHEQLPLLQIGSDEHHGVVDTLDNIEIVLARPEFRLLRTRRAEAAP